MRAIDEITEELHATRKLIRDVRDPAILSRLGRKRRDLKDELIAARAALKGKS